MISFGCKNNKGTLYLENSFV